MILRSSTFACMLLLVLLFPPQEKVFSRISPSESAISSGYLEKKMRRMMRKHHLPAFAISVVDGERVLFEIVLGYADLEKEVPATPQSIFKLYSVSKVFTALEIFREKEEGLIGLEDPITEHLPDFSIRQSFAEQTPVTIKSLLAHRSGLPRNECLNCPPAEEDPYTLHKFDWCTADCYMAYPPGFRYKYSNLGYNLLGRIVEQKRDMGFESYMKKHLLTDLGMKSSAFQSSDLNPSQTVAGGYEYYKGKYSSLLQSDIKNVPSGNLFSNLEDMSVFLRAILNNQVFAKANTLEQMFVDCYSTEQDPERMGLGWKTARLAGGEFMIWHDGGPDEGVGALVAAVPDQNLALAMIANSTTFGGNVSVLFAKELLEGLIREKDPAVEVRAKKEDRISLSEQVLDSYQGLYIAFGMPMEVKAKRKKLKAKIGGISLDLIPVSETEFKVTHWMDKIGLTKIIRPPVAFDKLRILYPPASSGPPGYSILNLDNISYEICPRYPQLERLPEAWEHLPGTYQLAWRLPDNRPGPLSGSLYTISWKDGILRMSGPFGPLLPVDDKFIKFTSMPFMGESMEYIPETGYLIHQNAIYIPVNE